MKRSEVDDELARKDTYQVNKTWTYWQVRDAFRSVVGWFKRRGKPARKGRS